MTPLTIAFIPIGILLGSLAGITLSGFFSWLKEYRWQREFDKLQENYKGKIKKIKRK